MAKRLCVLIRRAPHGSIHAFEAWRHARGGMESGFSVDVLLDDDGVYLAACRPADAGEWTELARAFGNMLRQGEPSSVHIAAGAEALALRGIRSGDLLDGVEIVGRGELAARIAAAPILAY